MTTGSHQRVGKNRGRPFLGVTLLLLVSCLAIYSYGSFGKQLKPALALHKERDAGGVPSQITIEVRGSKFRWLVTYPPESILATKGEPIRGQRNVHLPTDAEVTLALRSDDYIYLFEVPALGIRDVAVPDCDFQVKIVGQQRGEYELLGSQMCGYEHPELLGKLIVHAEDDFSRTIASLKN